MVETADGVPVKLVERGPAGRSAKADIDAVADPGEGHLARIRRRARAEREALGEDET